MLELNKWFFVLLINFLALIFILNIILFKPLIRIFKNREDTVKDSLSAAKDMTARKDSAIEDMKKGLGDAALRARAEFEALRAEGLNKQKDMISSATNDAMKLADEAKDALRQEAQKARKALRSDVEKFSDEIVKKLIKI